ncbi:hypothetical protein [Candidatus Berkiella aquae]|uniref:Uncharacterized protein n=1 Tax=Candidatus Berkiella aquae TaxID=295108 RepID=A0A0Q9YTA8_9GAMM|nr:hypothetical protein [Candidatus Berkiella aquae]MCS5710099.1 hypothetical protein [Candidatus Berkiella aquae]
MRELTQSEVIIISAGISCIDSTTFNTLQQHAIRDGVSFSLITGAITFAMAYGLFANPYAGVGVSLVLAPYAAGLGYFSSSAWTIFS